MTVKVGDKVRCMVDQCDVSVGDEYKVKKVDYEGVIVVDQVGDDFLLTNSEYEPITEPTAISAQIRACMEEYMDNGEYVRAVKWAQLAEQAEELENE